MNHQPGRLQPTSFALLTALGVAGAVLGWFLVPLLERTNRTAPTVPWSSVLLLVFAAAVLGGTAWSTWHTLHRRRSYLDPHRAVNYLVLAKASAVVGVFVAGAYLGFGAQFLDQLQIPLPRQRVVRSALAAVAALLLMVAGLLLERACKVPGAGADDEDEGNDDEGGTAQGSRTQ
ncbi:MAG TPA: DUF3180 domain-containing protein [Nocardioidaceae bacterium]|nr:DUF3180 domain-containing protein [Actinomycetota bacterium]MDQ3422209.1 DUF3180 domain-containing protein [Actinomycetota bacterium]HEV8055692.1 DUF3180 domain-containing protein [Nocardioidaceae bacterium]